MDKYLVTKLITKFGYYASVGIILLCAVAGFVYGKFGGFFAGTILGAVISVPAMMYCELAYAMIKTEENTRNNKAHLENNRHAA